LGDPLSKLCVTPPFSINFRCQIENQVSDYRLLGASSFVCEPFFSSIFLVSDITTTTFLKYMVICAFLNRPSIPSFLATQIVYIGYGQVFFLKYSFSFYLSIAVLLIFLYLNAANKTVLLLRGDLKMHR
jgi:hypothetical protein